MKKVILSLVMLLALTSTVQSREVSFEEKISGLYIAYFYRAADMQGLNYWKIQGDKAVSEGKTSSTVLRQLSISFAKHDLFVSHYGRLSNNNFVKEIYKNILDREGDAGGVNYWTGLLDNNMSRSKMIADFVDLSLTTDLTEENFPNIDEVELIIAQMRQDFLVNKVKVALYFTKRLGIKSNVENTILPENDPAYTASINILRGITRKDSTVASRITYIDSILSDDDPICGINEPLGSCGRNLAPIANAGLDKNATVNTDNIIIGQATDSDGTVVNYEWKEDGNVIANALSFTYQPTTLGVHILTLKVTDDDDATAVDSVIINVLDNQPPIANAGPDIQHAFIGGSLTITGSGVDNDGLITRYEWKEGITLLSNSPSFQYTASTEGEHKLTLTVVDDKGLIGTDMMSVVASINVAPEADAGDDKTATKSQAIDINGTGTDSDGTVASYRWTEGTTVLATTASFSYTPTTIGTHTLTLKVTDNVGATDTDSTDITVVENQAPTVEAGGDIHGNVNTTHSLTCTASDVDGTVIAYQWINSANTILSDLASFTYTLTAGGDTLTCKVTDNTGATASDTLTVTEDP